MRQTRLTNNHSTILVLLFVFFLSACSTGSMDGRILVTEVQQSSSNDFSPWDISKVEGARIVAISPRGNNKNVVNLTKDFFSAVSPVVSYDGKYMLFAGKKEAADHWQIWETRLGSGKVRQVTNSEEDCTNPVYLPKGHFAFSSLLNNKTVKNSNVLFSGNLDGTNIQQLTFSPQTFAGLSVLNDGRLIAMEKQVFPAEGKSKIMVLRPDGSKLELFYKSAGEASVQSKIAETRNEEILFIEKINEANKIVSVSYNMPMYSHKVVTSKIEGDFCSVIPYTDDQLLTSYRKTASEVFSLNTFNAKVGTLSEIYQSEGYNVVDAVLVQSYRRPRDLPSEIHPDVKTGLLVCQDINFPGAESLKEEGAKPKATKIEVLGIDSTLALVDVEKDGSFYLKVEANIPFRIQTLSENGEVVNGPGDWYYIRPNERRGCVGCHTGPDISPFNRQPLAIREKDPVFIANDSGLNPIQKMKDKEHE